MNTYKYIFRACNGTRIAQCSLLIALAFLCVSIVCVCVFYNFNALATNNIAFAEEEKELVRSNVNNGFCNDNLIQGNSIFIDSSSITPSSSMSANSWYCSNVSALTFTPSSNGLTITSSVGNVNLIYMFVPSDLGISNYCTFGSFVTYKADNNVCLTVYNNGSYSYKSYISSTNRTYYDITQYNNYNVLNGFGFTFDNANSSIRISFVKLEIGSTFSGLPLDNYSPNGYDAGYQDGLNAGGGSGSSSTDYSNISSTGIVRDNLVDNNDWSNVDYNLSVSSESRERIVRSQARSVDLTRATQQQLYTGTNFNAYINSFNGASGSLVDNTLTCTSGTLNLWYSVVSGSTPLLSNSTYTLTFGISHVSGDGFNNETGYLGVYVNGSAVELSDDFTDSSGAFITLTFTLSNLSNTQLNQVGFCLSVYDGCSVDIGWVKLEENDSFSGYVPKAYQLYGYNDGYNLGYNTGYVDGVETSSYASLIGYTQTDAVLFPDSVNETFVINGITYNIGYTYENPDLVNTFLPYGSGSGLYNSTTYCGIKIFDNMSVNCAFNVNLLLEPYLINNFNFSYYYFKVLLINNNNASDYSFINFLDACQVIGVHYFSRDFGYYRYNCKINIPSSNASYSVYLVYDYSALINSQLDAYASTFEFSALSGFIYTGIPEEDYGVGYDAGFRDGYDQGYGADAFQDGYVDGYDTGYDDGRSYADTLLEQATNNGYNNGYYEGRASTESYSFLSLIGAVFDAPISALTGLLNFNILGVNMLSFFLSIMSLALALFILKIVFK